ncbi:MAG: hypothetical protein EBE86_028330 [Hormoscilla sp. GUM202]|nr:hypothetical protein [Hormoscilla sp. GUM202]
MLWNCSEWRSPSTSIHCTILGDRPPRSSPSPKLLDRSGDPIDGRMTAKDWPHSSSNRYVRSGLLSDRLGRRSYPTLGSQHRQRKTETFYFSARCLGVGFHFVQPNLRQAIAQKSSRVDQSDRAVDGMKLISEAFRAIALRSHGAIALGFMLQPSLRSHSFALRRAIALAHVADGDKGKGTILMIVLAVSGNGCRRTRVHKGKYHVVSGILTYATEVHLAPDNGRGPKKVGREFDLALHIFGMMGYCRL